MAGKVYCFNCYNEPIHQLTVNGVSFGQAIGPWATSGAGTYTPVAAAVPRVRRGDGSAAAFPNDRPTQLRIDWDSFTGQAAIDLSALAGISLDDDLILFIAVNQMMLMQTRGFVLTIVPVNLSSG